jgi:hypothetical protein
MPFTPQDESTKMIDKNGSACRERSADAHDHNLRHGGGGG